MKMNSRKNKLLKNIWLTEKEYKELINNLEQNNKEEAGRVLMDIYIRGDLEQ